MHLEYKSIPTIKGTYINCMVHAILKYSPSIYCFCCDLLFIIGLEKLINGGEGGPIKLQGGGKNIKKLISGGGGIYLAPKSNSLLVLNSLYLTKTAAQFINKLNH